jgi:hypothetical protein
MTSYLGGPSLEHIEAALFEARLFDRLTRIRDTRLRLYPTPDGLLVAHRPETPRGPVRWSEPNLKDVVDTPVLAAWVAGGTLSAAADLLVRTTGATLQAGTDAVDVTLVRRLACRVGERTGQALPPLVAVGDSPLGARLVRFLHAQGLGLMARPRPDEALGALRRQFDDIDRAVDALQPASRALY